MEKLTLDIFEAFHNGWALLTAGTPENCNAMTISWGSLGTLWAKPVATVYVKPIRFTHQFLEENDYFTISFFSEKYRGDLLLLGTESGRDGNKLARTGLTPKSVGAGIGYEEAELTLVCRKLYRQDMVRGEMPADVVSQFYTPEEPHTMYIGETIDIIKNNS